MAVSAVVDVDVNRRQHGRPAVVDIPVAVASTTASQIRSATDLSGCYLQDHTVRTAVVLPLRPYQLWLRRHCGLRHREEGLGFMQMQNPIDNASATGIVFDIPDYVDTEEVDTS